MWQVATVNSAHFLCWRMWILLINSLIILFRAYSCTDIHTGPFSFPYHPHSPSLLPCHAHVHALLRYARKARTDGFTSRDLASTDVGPFDPSSLAALRTLLPLGHVELDVVSSSSILFTGGLSGPLLSDTSGQNGAIGIPETAKYFPSASSGCRVVDAAIVLFGRIFPR